jgi:hypothetical protein
LLATSSGPPLKKELVPPLHAKGHTQSIQCCRNRDAGSFASPPTPSRPCHRGPYVPIFLSRYCAVVLDSLMTDRSLHPCPLTGAIIERSSSYTRVFGAHSMNPWSWIPHHQPNPVHSHDRTYNNARRCRRPRRSRLARWRRPWPCPRRARTSRIDGHEHG